MEKENKSIYKKLLKVQAELGAVKKGKQNPFFKSNYADINDYLEVVKPILTKYGFILLQPIVGTNLSTVLIDAESGEKLETEATLPVNPDPQKQGSIITYFRRYAIQSLFALQAEDDDGNKVSGNSGGSVGSGGDTKYPPSTKQLGYLKTLLTKAGFTDDEAKFRYLTENLNTLIVSYEDLTAKQASKLIDGLLKPGLEKAEARDSEADEGHNQQILEE